MLTAEQLAKISTILARYEALSARERRAYQETEVRTNFIDPLFAALGWDMQDRDQVERESTVVDSKRPDYIFKLNGSHHLFLEAKRFSEDARSPDWARDAITKAYNKGVDWAGVTNVDALVIYDAYELVPPGGTPRTVLDLNYAQYASPDSLLADLTPEALAGRRMEDRAQSAGIRTRTIPIERRLYESMRQWREKLINDMARYQGLKSEEEFAAADQAVQKLLDRLIFLRHCEDRRISSPDLHSLLNRIQDTRRGGYVRVTEKLLELFAEAERVFDSEIFQPNALIDRQFRALIDNTDFDDTLSEIVKGLYHVPLSLAQYDFAQMDADVLGQVYEQYLGHVAEQAKRLILPPRLPGIQDGPRITVEAKRQHRRERGIYYTPTWVVEYVIRETLDKWLTDHRGDEDAVDNVSVLDLSCGSGSFLIQAYEHLLSYHGAFLGAEIVP